MSVKNVCINFLLFSLLLIIIDFIIFPISRNEMEKNSSGVISQNFSSDFSILETIEKKDSIFYHISTADEQDYLVQAEKSLIVGRYRINHPMTLFNEQIFEISDLRNEYKIIYDGNDVDVIIRMTSWKRLYPILFICVFIIINLLYSFYMVRTKKIT